MCQQSGNTHYDKCRNVLNNMYKMLCQARDLEKSKLLKNTKNPSLLNAAPKRDDLQYLAKSDQLKRQEIEKSSLYIGYYLMYVI
jgi:hypothetical protein